MQKNNYLKEKITENKNPLSFILMWVVLLPIGMLLGILRWPTIFKEDILRIIIAYIAIGIILVLILFFASKGKCNF